MIDTTFERHDLYNEEYDKEYIREKIFRNFSNKYYSELLFMCRDGSIPNNP